MKNMTRLERVQQMHNAFLMLQVYLSDFGARDSEPDYAYQNCLRRAIHGLAFVEPTGDNPWQLYSSVRGYKAANKTLTTGCKRVVRAIEGSLIKDVPDIREWAEANLHRVNMNYCP